MQTLQTQERPAIKMKKFVIREAETLKTTRPAMYDPDACPWV